jgi:VanZ family protein
MSAAPVVLNPTSFKPPSPIRKEWVWVLCTIIFICFTSTTFMGAATSQIVVNFFWKALLGNWHASQLGNINGILRKSGHFLGYGTVGLIFRNAWFKTARTFSLVVKNWLNPFAAFLAVVSTFIVGSLDEYHQMIIPGRVGCLRDALVDTAGSIFLNIVFLAVLARRRKAQDFNLQEGSTRQLVSSHCRPPSC